MSKVTQDVSVLCQHQGATICGKARTSSARSQGALQDCHSIDRLGGKQHEVQSLGLRTTCIRHFGNESPRGQRRVPTLDCSLVTESLSYVRQADKTR